MTAFTRAIVLTDLHFGRRSDLEQHNNDCLEFIDWVITQFHEHRCDAVIFMGDWFHNQVRSQWDTLWKSEQAIRKLSALGVPVYFCIGNHDMWFKQNREVHSHAMLHYVPNFHVINDLTLVDDCLFAPYLIGAEFNAVAQTKAKYVFGHFSFPGFLVNEGYKMPAGEGLDTEFFDGPEYVFSGHFHKRQWKTNSNGTNVIYIGNCFPHDFNDVGDRDRGCMIFERGVEPIFLNWKSCPNYNRIDLSVLLPLIESDLLLDTYNTKSVIHVTNDIDLIDPDLSNLRDWLGTQGFREIKIEPGPTPEEQAEPDQIQSPRENITDYFRAGLNQVDTEGSKYQLPLLQELFTRAMEKYDDGETL